MRNRELVELLLAQPGIKPDSTAQDGYTALLHAAEKNSVEIVILLLKAGADPNLKTGGGETLLAQMQREIEVRQAILSNLTAGGNGTR